MENVLLHNLDSSDILMQEILQFLFKETEVTQNLCREIKKLKKKKVVPKFQKYEKSWTLNLVYQLSERQEKVIQTHIRHHQLEHSSLWAEFKKIPLKHQFVFLLKSKYNISDQIISESLSLSLESIPFIFEHTFKILLKKHESILQNAPDFTHSISHQDILKIIEKSHATIENPPSESEKKLRKTPWYIRTSLEGGLIGAFIIGGIALIPNILNLYEKSLDRKLENFDLSQFQNLTHTPEDPVPLSPSTDKTLILERSQSSVVESPIEPLEKETPSIASKKFKINSQQYVRFVIASASIEEMRKSVSTLLLSLGAQQDETPENGLDVPGGIQFKVLLSVQSTIEFKNKMDELFTPKEGMSPLQTDSSSPFNWYINPSRKRLPKDMVEVVIFITQT